MMSAPGLDEVVHALGGDDVARHDRDLRVDGANRRQGFQHPLLVTVGGVDDQAVHAHGQQLARLARDVAVDADRGGNPQASAAVQGGLVEGGPQRPGAGQDADELTVVVHGGGEPVPCRGEYVEGLAGLHRVLQRRHLGGHRVAHAGEAVDAGAVGLGDDADRPPEVEHDGRPVGPLGEQCQRIADGVRGGERDRGLEDRVPLLDPGHHLGDDVERDVLRDDAESPTARHRLGHPSSGDGCHVGDDQRDRRTGAVAGGSGPGRGRRRTAKRRRSAAGP